MKCAKILLPIAIGLAVSSASADVLVEGVVALPPPKTGSAAQARYAQKSAAVAAPELPAAVVYLEGSVSIPAAPAKITVEQKGFQFSPMLLPVLKGTEVEFPNRDDDYHHVFSYSKSKEFDLGRYRKDEKPPPIRFDKPGTVRVGCEIHDHMRAVVLVLETPYFCKTDEKGAYQLAIKGPLAGSFVLKAWINDKTLREEKVELKDGAKLKVDFPSK